MTETAIAKQVIETLIIDDHAMIREGLKMMLASLHKSMLFKITEAESGEEALIRISHADFKLVIIDYQLPGISGAETVLRILRYLPDMKILALSNYDELPYIQSMMEAGAKGFVLKNIEAAEMLNAIKATFADKIYYCSEVAVKLIDATQDKTKRTDAGLHSLTVREMEVLKLIAKEMTNDEIARALCVAKRTVDTHRQNLLNKLNVKNTVGLVKFAYKHKLVSEE